MKYESSIFIGLKVMAKVKVFVYAANADANADADGRAMTLAPGTWLAKKVSGLKRSNNSGKTDQNMTHLLLGLGLI